MLTIFSTGKAHNKEIKNFKDPKIKQFVKSVHQVMLNLAKRVVIDGEGATKFITINCKNSKSEKDAKNICFSIANSPLVKTAITGEDPNWGRIAMAIGKSGASINVEKLSISIGHYLTLKNGKLVENYNEKNVSDYMKNENIEITVNLSNGSKDFTTYTMDLSKEYIDINSDYRS